MSHMGGDPAGSSRHDEVRGRLEAGEPACAQATVAAQLVSYHRYGLSGFVYDYPMPEGMHHGDIMEAVILEVAHGRGATTARTCSPQLRRHADRHPPGVR